MSNMERTMRTSGGSTILWVNGCSEFSTHNSNLNNDVVMIGFKSEEMDQHLDKISGKRSELKHNLSSASSSASLSTSSRSSTSSTGLPTHIEAMLIQQYEHNNKINSKKNIKKSNKGLNPKFVLPLDPSDPAAFTTNHAARPSSSDYVVKIVSSAIAVMSLALILALLYLHCFSDVFRPMMNKV